MNFGGPQRPSELVPFLTALFADVLPVPKLLGRLLAPRIATRRAAFVRTQYERIDWSPLVPTTRRQMFAVRAALGADAPPMEMGMMFSEPSIGGALQALREQAVDTLIVLGLFPHYSFATSGSAYDAVSDALRDAGLSDLPVHYVGPFYDHPRYVAAVADTIRFGLKLLPGEGPVNLLFSPHGLPLSFVRAGDPYPEQVTRTVDLVREHLDWRDPWHIGWQSRVGPVKWLSPSTPEVTEQIGAVGGERLLVVPVSFVSEHIETLYELDVDLAETARKAGIRHFGRAPALGLSQEFLTCLSDLVRNALLTVDMRLCPKCRAELGPRDRRGKACPSCAFSIPRWLARA